MRYETETDIGGSQKRFLSTQWTLIEEIQSGSGQNRALIDLLIRRYWKPAYCFLRRKGYDNEHAKDLTQGFFEEVVLRRKLIQRADASKGRFRSFLLHALQHYALDEQAKETAHRRIPKGNLAPLESSDLTDPPASLLGQAPEASFHYAWVSALLDEVLCAVETSCREDGFDTHWELFHARLVQPALAGEVAPSLEEIGRKWGVSDPARVSNMIITVKRRFRETLKRCVRRTITARDHVQDELEEMAQYLPQLTENSD